MGLWCWLLGFTDRFRGFGVVAVRFKVVYEITGFVRAVGMVVVHLSCHGRGSTS